MQAMKLEKDNAVDRAEQAEQQARDANLRAEKSEEEVRGLQKKIQQIENELDQVQEQLSQANVKLEEKEKTLQNVSISLPVLTISSLNSHLRINQTNDLIPCPLHVRLGRS